MDIKALRQKILDLAIRGKLVPQDPNDEPASVLFFGSVTDPYNPQGEIYCRTRCLLEQL